MVSRKPDVDSWAMGSIKVESFTLDGDERFINSAHPVRVYRGVLAQRQVTVTPAVDTASEAAAAFEALFARHGWPPAWRAGLYTVHHYHSTAHEVLGIFSGWVKARLGGEAGMLVTLRAGDALLLPAGVAHCNEGQSSDFCAVGAYPRGMQPDMRYGRESERAVDLKRLAALPAHVPDPIFGDASVERARIGARADSASD
jgi:uncharacterized protein YjlB